jgi:hypothetical protein
MGDEQSSATNGLAPISDLRVSGATVQWALDRSKKGRRGRPRVCTTATGAIDRRSLRATGRTEHLNWKATPTIKKALDRHVGHGKKSLWLEEAIVAKLKTEGIEIEP